MVLFCCFGSLVTPRSLEKRAGGVVERVWWSPSQLDHSPESSLLVWSCYCSVYYDIYCPLFYWKLLYKAKKMSRKIHFKKPNTFSLEFNYLHALLWHIKVCLKYAGQRRFVNSVKYLPRRFNTTQPEVWCVMIKSCLSIFNLGAFCLSVTSCIKWPHPFFWECFTSSSLYLPGCPLKLAIGKSIGIIQHVVSSAD